MGKKKTRHFSVIYFLLPSSDYSIIKSNDERLHTQFCHDTEISNEVRVGIIISKRNVKNSVTRNLIRRWIKESLRDCNIFADIVIKVDRPILFKSKLEKSLIFKEVKKLTSTIPVRTSKVIY